MEMEKIIVKNQEQLNKIRDDYNGIIFLEGGTYENPLVLKINFKNAYVIARGNACFVMRENSQVSEMRGNSQVSEMRENSQVSVMRGNSQVSEMRGNSQVSEMRENSQVSVMRGNSQVSIMRGNSQVKLFGEAMVSAISAKKIVCNGYNIVKIRKSDKEKVNVKMNKTSHLIIIPDFKPTWTDYKKRFPSKIKSKKAIFYKAVHKKNGKYFSDNTINFEYKIGKTIKHKNDPSKDNSCSYGLHIAHYFWARDYGRGWDDLAILEVEVPISKIVVAKDCDGKCRTSELKVIREVPLNFDP